MSWALDRGELTTEDSHPDVRYVLALGDNLRKVQTYVDGSSEAMRRWSQEIDVNLSAPGVLSQLMMRAALWANPKGIVLFSSKVNEHIQANAQLARSSDIEDARAVALYRAVQRDLAATPQERAA